MKTIPMLKMGNFLLMTVPEFAEWLPKNLPQRKITRLQNHHTFKPDYSNFYKKSDHAALLHGMENYHVKTNKWSWIGQNITTFPDGMIAICRSFEKAPAGIKGANTGALCLEHVGNFDYGQDNMTETHKQAIIFVNALLCYYLGMLPDTNSLIYHHWFNVITGKRDKLAEICPVTNNTKSCPGAAFFGGNTLAASNRFFIPSIKYLWKQLHKGISGLYLYNQYAMQNNESCTLKYMKVKAKALNIRPDPGTSGKPVGLLKQNEIVVIYQQKENWVRVHPTGQYWVSTDWLEPLTDHLFYT